METLRIYRPAEPGKTINKFVSVKYDTYHTYGKGLVLSRAEIHAFGLALIKLALED